MAVEPGYAAGVLQTVATGDLSVSVTVRKATTPSMLFAVHGMVEQFEVQHRGSSSG